MEQVAGQRQMKGCLCLKVLISTAVMARAEVEKSLWLVGHRGGVFD